MTKQTYVVDIAFPFDGDMTVWRARTDACLAAVGDGVPCDSGTGCGQRDMQFFFGTQQAAFAARDRLRSTGLPFDYMTVEQRTEDD